MTPLVYIGLALLAAMIFRHLSTFRFNRARFKRTAPDSVTLNSDKTGHVQIRRAALERLLELGLKPELKKRGASLKMVRLKRTADRELDLILRIDPGETSCPVSAEYVEKKAARILSRLAGLELNAFTIEHC